MLFHIINSLQLTIDFINKLRLVNDEHFLNNMISIFIMSCYLILCYVTSFFCYLRGPLIPGIKCMFLKVNFDN